MLGASVGAGRNGESAGKGAFSVGCAAGGLVTATAIVLVSGLTGWIPVSMRVVMALVGAAILLARDLGILTFPLVESRRQIPREVFNRGPIRAGLHFGFELGTGVRTHVPSSAPYVVLVALVLLSPPVPAVLGAGAAFGLGRAMLVWRWPKPSSASCDGWSALLHRRGSWLVPVSTALCCAVVSVLSFSEL
jgi:hypothetical protein